MDKEQFDFITAAIAGLAKKQGLNIKKLKYVVTKQDYIYLRKEVPEVFSKSGKYIHKDGATFRVVFFKNPIQDMGEEQFKEWLKTNKYKEQQQ